MTRRRGSIYMITCAGVHLADWGYERWGLRGLAWALATGTLV